MPGPEDNQVGPSDPPLPPPPAPASSTTPTTDPETPDPPVQQPPPRQPPRDEGCCKNRSTLEKCLLVFLLIVFLLFVAFLIGFVVLYYWKGEPRAFCTKDSCVEAAARMNSFMDRTVNPCDNFYEYACGNWMKGSLIPDDEPEVTVYTQMQEEVRIVLKKLLEEENRATDVSAVQKARDFYMSCVNEDLLEAAGSEPLERLAGSVGRWPSLDSAWNETDFELDDILLALSRTRPFAHLPLFTADIKPDFEDPSSYAIYIGQGRLGMENASREAYLRGGSSLEVRAYRRMLERLLVELGVDPTTALMDAKDVVDFETQLANISLSDEQLKNTIYEVTSIDDLESKYPDFDWVNFINGLVQYGPAPPQITPADRIILTPTAYLNRLFPLLDKTAHRVKANYLLSMLWKHAAHISEPFRRVIAEYYKQLKGVEPQRSRWEMCVEMTDDVFPEVTGRLFVQSAFGREERDNIVQLVSNLKSAFIDIIRQTEWMTTISKNAAIDKAKALRARVGYPDYVMDDGYLNDKYAEYNMSREAFFDNTLRVNYLRNLEKVLKFREPVDENTWSFSAATVRAYYDTKHNELVFPAGFVQPPVYRTSYPRSMNYGGVGSFIGREMTHGFDETGSHYDKEGQARQWWTPADMVNYQEQAECMVDHYSCFRWKPARMNIDGLRTLGENIADNGGLKQSYRAYRHWVEERGIEERLLPGLNLTHNQLFFLSFAQLWCTNDRDDYKVHKILTDKFAPAPFRVIGTLQNSEDFAEAFRCPVGSRMNPEKKCKVW